MLPLIFSEDIDNIRQETQSSVLISTTVYSASGEDVCLTMVQGKILYENGQFTTIDVEKAIYEVEQYAVPLVRGCATKDRC